MMLRVLKSLRWCLLLMLIAGLVLPPAAPARAAGVSFTVTVKSAFLRSAPSFSGARMYSVFSGQAFAIVGRSADSAWLLLDFPGGAPGSSWIAAVYGQVEGDLAGVAVTGVTGPGVPSGAGTPPVVLSAPTLAASVGVAGPVYFTVTAKSMFGRAGPDAGAARVVSLFQNERRPATARSADGLWVRLELPGGIPAWVRAASGTVTGAVAALPVAGGAAAPRPSVPPTSAPPPQLVVSQTARDIYQRGLALGNNPRAFSKVGDCNSATPYFLAPFDKGEYRLGGAYAYLQPAIDHFAGSFNRDGAVARDGLNTASVFDSIWSLPALCQKGESPLACEVRTQRPSLAIISLGTNGDWQTNAEYEANMRRILDLLIERGVVPILSTKADNLEGGDRFNQIVAKLAAEYALPLWDFAPVARALPGWGLADTYHLVWGQSYYDTAPRPLTGWQARNLTALQALDAVWRGLQ